MTKKQNAINEMNKAVELLYKYRGIPYNEYSDVCISKRETIKDINQKTQSFLNELNIHLQPATEKQINYIASLASKFNKTKDMFLNARLNKYQASVLIEIYIEMNDLLHDNSMYAMSKETWDEFDKDIEFILSHKTL